MEGQAQRLARHVAEAADAWLRDPLDAGVYRRLVDATRAWRAHTAGGEPSPGTAPTTAVGDLGHAGMSDDDRFLRPERAPQRLGGTLDDVASMLRARAGSVGPQAGPTEGPATDEPAGDERPS